MLIWVAHLVFSVMLLQPTSQSQETGALPVIRAATDPTLTGGGFKYFGPFYKGPINANIGNEGTAGIVHLVHQYMPCQDLKQSMTSRLAAFIGLNVCVKRNLCVARLESE